MSENTEIGYMIYDRQRNLVNYVPSSIAVVGVGGIGSWVAILGAMAGVRRINLFDSDEIEEHNLNRILAYTTYVHERKTIAIRDLISALRPDISIACYSEISEINLPLLDTSQIIFVCVDRMRVRAIIEEYFNQKLRFEYINGMHPRLYHLTSEGDHFCVEENILDSWDNNPEQDGYTEPLRQWVVPQVVVASLALGLAFDKIPRSEFSATLSDIGTKLGLIPHAILAKEKVGEQ